MSCRFYIMSSAVQHHMRRLRYDDDGYSIAFSPRILACSVSTKEHKMWKGWVPAGSSFVIGVGINGIGVVFQARGVRPSRCLRKEAVASTIPRTRLA